MTTAIIFPGQGSQQVGMGQDLHDAFPAARAVFQEVDEALGEPLSRLMFAGEESELTLTRNAQPALMAVSIAIIRTLENEGAWRLSDRAAFVAGHSLGEYTALAAAGCLALGDAARLLRLRGEAMQQAVPVGAGAMAALLGADLVQAEAIAQAAEEGEVCVIGNDNAPGQVVVSGAASAVERAVALAPEHGIKRAVMLPVSAPFHSPLLSPAAETMAAAFETISFNPLAVPGGLQRDRAPGPRGYRCAGAAGAPGDGDGALARERASYGERGRGYADRGRRRQGAHRACAPHRPELERKRGRHCRGRRGPLGNFSIGAAGSGSGEQHGMFDLSGKVALVTGASGGIGNAIAEALHAQGAAVALSGRRAEALEALASKLGEGAQAVPCDLADRDALAALPERAAEALGAPAILVHCGGITRDGLALRMKDEDWQEVLEVNLSAGFVLARACLRGMIRQRWGRLIFITSVVGTTGNAGQANYAASKAGLAGMVKALAAETAARGVTANCVAPGFIETAMTDALADAQKEALLGTIPAGRFGEGSDVAAACVYLASEEARYVTGQTLHVNGGMAMI